MFLAEALCADHSCQKVVHDRSVKRLVLGLPPGRTPTGAYCRARKRLPVERIHTLARHAGEAVSARAPTAWPGRGHPVRLVDGTIITMPDTVAHPTAYPQPRSQKPGLGFPPCRIVGLICLGSGAVLNASMGACRGKGRDEPSMRRSILDPLKPGDVRLGGAFYAPSFLLCSWRERGVDGVLEPQGSRQRTTDFNPGPHWGPRDPLIVLPKPALKPDWMSQADFDQAPKTLTVRELHTGGKTRVTTWLGPKQTDKAALRALYRDRWHGELDLRNIKTTRGRERVSRLTPERAIKEIGGGSTGLPSDSINEGAGRMAHPSTTAPDKFQAFSANLARRVTLCERRPI